MWPVPFGQPSNFVCERVFLARRRILLGTSISGCASTKLCVACVHPSVYADLGFQGRDYYYGSSLQIRVGGDLSFLSFLRLFVYLILVGGGVFLSVHRGVTGDHFP